MVDIPAARTWHDRPHWGIWLMTTSLLIHVSGTAFEKMLLGIYPLYQMIFFRALFRLFPLFVTLFKVKDIKAIFYVQQPLTHLFRLIAYVSYNYCILYVLSQTSLTVNATFQYITPFFVIGLSVLFLKEKMDKIKWIALLTTTVGVIVALKPFSKVEFNSIILLILFACLLGSLNRVLIRKLTASEHSLAITVYGNLAMALCSFPFVLMHWHPMTWYDLSFFAIAAILSATAQFLSVHALRFAQVSLLTTIDCTSLVWVVLFDYFFWQKIPNIYLVLGALIIIGSNIYLLKSTRKTSVPSRNLS